MLAQKGQHIMLYNNADACASHSIPAWNTENRKQMRVVWAHIPLALSSASNSNSTTERESAASTVSLNCRRGQREPVLAERLFRDDAFDEQHTKASTFCASFSHLRLVLARLLNSCAHKIQHKLTFVISNVDEKTVWYKMCLVVTKNTPVERHEAKNCLDQQVNTSYS